VDDDRLGEALAGGVLRPGRRNGGGGQRERWPGTNVGGDNSIAEHMHPSAYFAIYHSGINFKWPGFRTAFKRP
jgi:hypothetical protein